MKRLTSGLTEMFARLTEFARFDVYKYKCKYKYKVIMIQIRKSKTRKQFHKVARRDPV